MIITKNGQVDAHFHPNAAQVNITFIAEMERNANGGASTIFAVSHFF